MHQLSLVDCFSQEIIDLILDNFRLDDFHLEPDEAWSRGPYPSPNLAALKACSVVCRVFTPRCQYHLFSAVWLSDSQNEDTRERQNAIHNMMLVKPHVANGLRHVSLAIGEKGINKEDFVQPGLLRLLREQELTSIHITTHPSDSFIEEHYPNPRGIEKYFIRPFIQTSFITCLELAFTVICTSLLACFPNLANLALYESEFEPSSSRDYKKIAAPQPRPCLQTLRISSNSFVEDILRICGTDELPLLDLSQLRVLKTSEEDDVLPLDRAFDICAKTLERLDVSGEFGATEAFCRTYSLARFPRLAVLSLLAQCTLEEEEPSTNLDPFVDHCRLMETLPSQNSMERVAIILRIKSMDTLSPLCCLDVPGWDELDARFTLIADGKALEINLIIEWAMIRQIVADDRKAVPYDKDLEEHVRAVLQTTLVPAIRKKLKRVGSSPNIVFNIVIDNCSIITRCIPSTNPA